MLLVSKHRGFSEGIQGYQSRRANSKAPQNAGTTPSQKYDSSLSFIVFLSFVISKLVTALLIWILVAEELFLYILLDNLMGNLRWNAHVHEKCIYVTFSYIHYAKCGG